MPFFGVVCLEPHQFEISFFFFLEAVGCKAATSLKAVFLCTRQRRDREITKGGPMGRTVARKAWPVGHAA